VSFERRISAYHKRLEASLDRWLPPASRPPGRLHEAMRYAVLGTGKRFRPLLIYAVGEALRIPAERLDAPACAVEIIHAYSLIHDDLPAMDDDDLRRGRATCHRAFDEATAILAGDALQVLAFHILTRDKALAVDADTRLAMLATLAVASGSEGMAGGQALDLSAIGQRLELTELEFMHILKTGALIRACVQLPALCRPDLDNTQRDALDHYGKCLGLAFQVQDDILDVEGETATLGKTRGADLARNKPTFPSILGIARSRDRARELQMEAEQAIEFLGEQGEPLRWLSEYVVSRSH
jgi:farnesyl diphosphate synthase